MGIKWEDVKVLIGALDNEIYLGKLDKSGKCAIDQSEPRTEEVKAAIMRYLDNLCIRNGWNGVEFECEAGKLIWERKMN